MHSQLGVIDRDILRRLYIDEQLTTAAIATQFHCDAITIRRRLREFQILVRPRGPRPAPNASWSPDLWSKGIAWAVGVIATDGCLSSDGRHLVVTSKDLDLLQTVKASLGVRARITSMSAVDCHRLQWSDVVMYRWLLALGLMPAKSLRLGKVHVPDEWFRDFFRGCIDGDGSIVTYTDHYNVFKSERYVYTRLYLSIISASPPFIEWLRETLRRLVGVSGDIAVSRPKRATTDLWRLRYAKRESLILLRWMYYADEAPCLRRKRDRAAAFLASTPLPPRRGPGRPMVG